MHFERAAHDDDVPREHQQAGLLAVGVGRVRERPDAHQVDLPREAEESLSLRQLCISEASRFPLFSLKSPQRPIPSSFPTLPCQRSTRRRFRPRTNDLKPPGKPRGPRRGRPWKVRSAIHPEALLPAGLLQAFSVKRSVPADLDERSRWRRSRWKPTTPPKGVVVVEVEPIRIWLIPSESDCKAGSFDSRSQSDHPLDARLVHCRPCEARNSEQNTTSIMLKFRVAHKRNARRLTSRGLPL